MATLVAAGAIACPSSAVATVTHAGGYTYVKRSESIGNGNATATARCPGDTHVLAGGDLNPGTEEGDFLIRRQEFIDDGDPDSKPDDGYSNTQANHTDGSSVIWAQAVCGKRMPKYRHDKVKLGPTSQTNVAPHCKNGETAISSAAAPSQGVVINFAINSSFPTGTEDYTLFLEHQTTGNRNVETTAACLRANVQMAITEGAAGPDARSELTATCPTGTFVISGGQANGGFYHEAAQVTADQRAPREFRAGVDNFTDDPFAWSTRALCMKAQ